MVKLVSAEGAVIDVDRDIIEQSALIRNILQDVGDTGEPIPVPNVSGPILSKVIEYCTHHRDEPERRMRSDTLGSDSDRGFDHNFCKVDQGTLFDIILAANFLDIQPLLDVACLTVAYMMKGKSVEEIRSTFNVQNDFDEEEEAKVRSANAWCEN
ncbi:E3 ubiquitin ligase SCF complex, Skp subunit [Linderina pennispora]|uniref:E3 ubiquitin ligase complex SCF subunit n=1 Tax=Linderina pennispora TaxID=61395 RepID=A0A1Y1W0J3_9FUNG|nr:E3 ubiquitin ligase SCF complex, Skp subunit [Linderina pennispora]ORX67023.1 E3 ubiquitin ligase SCF complex, Skp subunit [Linderina pennispora]